MPTALITFDLDAIRAAGGLEEQVLEFRCDRAGINDACLEDPRGKMGTVHMAALVSAPKPSNRFSSTVGTRRSPSTTGFGATPATGDPLRADGRFVEFRVSLPPNAKWLTLLAASAAIGFLGDHAVWSGARLETAR